MATKEFTSKTPAAHDYATEIQGLVKGNFPVTVEVDQTGKLTKVSYETEWQEGSTKPVTNKKGEIIDYKPEYKKCSLAKDEIKKIDDYIAGLGIDG